MSAVSIVAVRFIWLQASGMQFIRVTIFHRLLFHVGGTKFQCSHEKKDQLLIYEIASSNYRKYRERYQAKKGK